MKISVTQQCVADGERGSHCNCPVALAIRRSLGVPATAVNVNAENIQIGTQVFKTPSTLGKMINLFDRNGTMLPCEFEV